MCLQCHQNLNDTVIVSQLQECLKTGCYSNINATSISHFTIAAVGLNGSLAQQTAIQVLEAYIAWKRNNILESDNNFFGQPSYQLVEKQLNNIHQFNKTSTTNNLSANDIRDLFYHIDTDNGKRVASLFSNLDTLFVDMVESYEIHLDNNNNNLSVQTITKTIKDALDRTKDYMKLLYEKIKEFLSAKKEIEPDYKDRIQ
jgi:hypothetical protein